MIGRAGAKPYWRVSSRTADTPGRFKTRAYFAADSAKSTATKLQRDGNEAYAWHINQGAPVVVCIANAKSCRHKEHLDSVDVAGRAIRTCSNCGMRLDRERYFATHRQLTGAAYIHHAYVYDRVTGKPVMACAHSHGARRSHNPVTGEVKNQGAPSAQACADRMLKAFLRRTPVAQHNYVPSIATAGGA